MFAQLRLSSVIYFLFSDVHLADYYFRNGQNVGQNAQQRIAFAPIPDQSFFSTHRTPQMSNGKSS